jgi:hypothetical protein
MIRFTVQSLYRYPFFQKKSFWIAFIFAGILLKLALFPFETGDYQFFWLRWINFIQTHG